MPLPMPKNDWLWRKLLLSALALSVTGCSTCCQKQTDESLQLPKPPSVSTPLPQTSYSDSASENIKTWQQKLKDTQLMSKP